MSRIAGAGRGDTDGHHAQIIEAIEKPKEQGKWIDQQTVVLDGNGFQSQLAFVALLFLAFLVQRW